MNLNLSGGGGGGGRGTNSLNQLALDRIAPFYYYFAELQNNRAARKWQENEARGRGGEDLGLEQQLACRPEFIGLSQVLALGREN